MPPAGSPPSPLWHSAGSRLEHRGLSECTIRSWRRLLPSPDFIAVSLGLLLQLAGRSDLWLPLLFSIGSFPVGPRQICFSCGVLKGCSAVAAGGSDPRVEGGRWILNGPALSFLCCSHSTRTEPGGTCCCCHGTPELHQGSTAGTKQGGHEGTKHKAKSPCHANETFL